MLFLKREQLNCKIQVYLISKHFKLELDFCTCKQRFVYKNSIISCYLIGLHDIQHLKKAQISKQPPANNTMTDFVSSKGNCWKREYKEQCISFQKAAYFAIFLIFIEVGICFQIISVSVIIYISSHTVIPLTISFA